MRRIVHDGEARVPELERPELLAPHLGRIRELYATCTGNLVRVHEELAADDVRASYTCLTAFCRRHHIGRAPKEPAGEYHFEPGEEMQHDTSPHVITVGGVARKYDCASLVLCYSRMIYAQVYRRWSRLACRIFLSEALVEFGGAASRCMIDNSSIIIARGNGSNAVPADEMLALGQRFGFGFVAHELGDANRSARVERPFDYIERNFYPGRTFEDDDDLNVQLREWCQRANRKPKRSLKCTPHELWVAERPALRPLPIHVPEVYEVHTRRIDVEGYANLHGNRYSVPGAQIGRQVELRETARRVRIYDGHRLVGDHARLEHGAGKRSTLPEHREARKPRHAPVPHSPEEKLLRAASPDLAQLCDLLRARHGGGAVRAIRRLHRLYLDYPTASLVAASRTALAYGLCDLGRLETMVLRGIAGDFFRLPVTTHSQEHLHDQEDRQDPPRSEPGAEPDGVDDAVPGPAVDVDPPPEPGTRHELEPDAHVDDEADFDIVVIDDDDGDIDDGEPAD